MDYKSKGIQLHLGDCTKILPSLPENSVDLILTDIPYNEVNRQSGGLRIFDKKDADDTEFDMDFTLNELLRISKGWIVIFCGTMQISDIAKRFNEENLKMVRVGVWSKPNPSPVNGQLGYVSGLEFCVLGKKSKSTFNRKVKKAEWKHNSGRSKFHPTEKPESLFKEIILDLTNEEDTVLDCFMGSGTAGAAAIRNNRNFIGIELNEKYYNYAKDRIKNSNPFQDNNLFEW